MINFEKTQTEDKTMIEAEALADAVEKRREEHKKDELPEQSLGEVLREHHIRPRDPESRPLIDIVEQILADRVIARAQARADKMPEPQTRAERKGWIDDYYGN